MAGRPRRKPRPHYRRGTYRVGNVKVRATMVDGKVKLFTNYYEDGYIEYYSDGTSGTFKFDKNGNAHLKGTGHWNVAAYDRLKPK